MKLKFRNFEQKRKKSNCIIINCLFVEFDERDQTFIWLYEYNTSLCSKKTNVYFDFRISFWIFYFFLASQNYIAKRMLFANLL